MFIFVRADFVCSTDAKLICAQNVHMYPVRLLLIRGIVCAVPFQVVVSFVPRIQCIAVMEE